jgi:hypothetical protein
MIVACGSAACTGLVGVGVLQDRDPRLGTRLLQRLVGLHLGVGAGQQGDALDIVGAREIHELGALRVHGHELDDDVDLAGVDVRDAGGRVLTNELDLGLVVEEGP